MKLNASIGLLVTAFLILSSACETEDIEPTIIVSLSTSQVNVFEDQGQATITANLNAEAPQAVSLGLLLSGTAQADGVDYSISGSNLTIPEGGMSASVTLNTVQDTLEEGNESIDISIASVNGAEISESNNQLSLTLEDDDVAATAQILVNEVLYDPPSGAAGDANGDGTRDANEDEFVEFYNSSSQPLDMSGYMIYDTEALASNTPRHVIPNGTVLQPRKVLVVFGGGTPTGNFGGAIVQATTTGRMNLNNSGDKMTMTDSTGNVVAEFDVTPLSNNPDESYTRNPDITGDFEQHSRIDNIDIDYSPGTKIDGSPF